MRGLITAELLQAAARRHDAPERLLKAADAVTEGRITWDELANPNCPDPLAQALHTARARKVLSPVLERAAANLAAGPSTPPNQRHPQRIRTQTEEEDYSNPERLASDLFESTSDPREYS